jgi:hypothetical protein
VTDKPSAGTAYDPAKPCPYVVVVEGFPSWEAAEAYAAWLNSGAPPDPFGARHETEVRGD